ncbi:uncharacterized protein LOC131878456 [Tigriopus californicus]|uniref:uncharacterized protein LOC131878456 n=1 Tax=Tigriopus californicus TaxID=6832 RepID=UPI0027D9F9E1|nr:uncharacterized protein LOC131878456 [Tigriopus californicus]
MEAHNLSTGFLLSRILGDNRYNITEFGLSRPKPWADSSGETIENLSNIIPQALVQQRNDSAVSESVGEPRLIKVSDSAWSIVKSIGKPIGNLISFLTSSGEEDQESERSSEDTQDRFENLKNHGRFKPRRGKKKRRWKIRYYHEYPRVPPKVHFRRPWRGRPKSYLIQDDEMLPSSSDQDIVRSTVKTIPNYIRNRLRPQPLSKNYMTAQEYDWHKKWANLNYLEYIPPKQSHKDNNELQYEDYDDPGYFDRGRENCDDYEICHDETVVEIGGPNGNKTDLLVKFVPVFPDSTKPLPYYKSVFLHKDKDVSKIDEGLDSIALGSDLIEEVRNVEPSTQQELSETRVQYSSNRPKRRRRKPRPVRVRPYRRVQRPSYSPPTYRRRRPRPIIIKHYANRRVGTAVSPGVLAALPLVLISGLAIGFLAPNVFNVSLSSITSGTSSSTNSSLGTIDLLNQFNIGGPNVTNNIFNNNTNGASNVNNDNDTITNVNMPRYFDNGPQFADTSWLGFVEAVGRSLFSILGTSPGTFPHDLVQSAQQVTFPEVVGSMTNLGRRLACSLKSPRACQGLVICEQIQDNNNMYGSNLLVKAGEYLVVGASWWDEIDPALQTMTNMAYIAAREDCYQEFKDCNETMITECSEIF